jgi:bifunctional DNA-binding transcriptional regulator/antitoxin component of YhaV-PrlF toxin-antitoxin module
MEEQAAVGAKFVRVLRGGQITLPIEFRRALGIEEGMILAMHQGQDGVLHMRPAPILTSGGKGSPWLRELYELFEPVRREIEEKGYTEEEVNQWIDDAVAEYRKERVALRDSESEQVENAPVNRRTA